MKFMHRLIQIFNVSGCRTAKTKHVGETTLIDQGGKKESASQVHLCLVQVHFINPLITGLSQDPLYPVFRSCLPLILKNIEYIMLPLTLQCELTFRDLKTCEITLCSKYRA